MGKVMSILTRKVNRFNVENRAHRFLERDKPVAAPKYESNLKDVQRALEEDPDFLIRESKKDSVLDERLKQVYVTSKDSFIDYGLKRATDDGRPLPLDRHTEDDFEFGFKEPERVSRGRCTLRQAMKFITDHQGDTELWTKQKIAEEYKIKEETVDKILMYFKSFQIYIPDKNKRENILTQAKTKFIKSKEDSKET